MGHPSGASNSEGDCSPSPAAGHHHPLSCSQGPAKVQCKGRDSSDSVEDDNRITRRCGQRPAPKRPPPVWQCCDAARFDPHSAGQHEEEWPSATSLTGTAGVEGETLRGDMMKWAFINSSVWCYMNACVWGTMWSLTFACRPAKASGYLQGIATVARLSSGLPFKLTKCPALQQALREWYSLHPGSKQQDGAEFCTVELAKMVGIQWGTYAARCQFDVPEKHALHQPILLLPLPSRHPAKQQITLQALIFEWHEAMGKLRALESRPEVMRLQLERCSDIHTKKRNLFPVFAGTGLRVEWHSYHIRALLMHRGERPSRGHFRTILFQGSDTWLADDGRVPATCKVTGEDERDLYTIWLTVGSRSSPTEYPVQALGTSPEETTDSIQHILARFF